MPLKKILYADDLNNMHLLNKRIIRVLLNPYYDFKPYYTISSAKFFNKFLEQSFGLKENRVLETGLPRCDVFFQDNNDLDRLY